MFVFHKFQRIVSRDTEITKKEQGQSKPQNMKANQVKKLKTNLMFFRRRRKVCSSPTTDQHSPICFEVLESFPAIKRRNGICLKLEEIHYDEGEGESLANQHRELIIKIRLEDIGIIY